MLALESPVLVLNRLWQPVNICAARRAVTLLFTGHAQVVHIDPEMNFLSHDIESWVQLSDEIDDLELIRAISIAVRVPAIIVLSEFDRLPRREVKFTRQNVFQRDAFTCQYCARTFEVKKLNLDHVMPRDKGGKTTWENVVCSCVRCNTRKANKLPAEVNMFPIREPRPPRWRPLFSAGDGRVKIRHESWRHFLEPSPAGVQLTG